MAALLLVPPLFSYLPPLTLRDGQKLPRIGFDASQQHNCGFETSTNAWSPAFVDVSNGPMGTRTSGHFTMLVVASTDILQLRVRAAHAACSCMIDLLVLQLDRAWDADQLRTRWSTAVAQHWERTVVSLGIASPTLAQAETLLNTSTPPAVVFDAASEAVEQLCDNYDTALLVKAERFDAASPAHSVQFALQRGYAVHLGQRDCRATGTALSQLQMQEIGCKIGRPGSRHCRQPSRTGRSIENGSDITAQQWRGHILGTPVQELEAHVAASGDEKKWLREETVPFVVLRAGEADPLCLGSTSQHQHLLELRLAPRLAMPPLNYRLGPISITAMRAAPNADALGLVSEFGVHVVRPADMDTRYTQLARTVGLAVRAAFEQGRSVANKYSGSSHVLVLQGYSDAKGPRGFAGGALAALIKDFLVPWLAEHAFNGAKPRLKQLTISRNQLAHPGQPQKRSLANLWHYDSLPNRLAKVLLYLSDVDERHACMAVMRRALLVPA
jgi:hypothetical protein